ncbi:hypothetical protein H6F77_16130 [Microcoleus sp. FACHB-831]|uniref:hypothetical protein n=1 Tax=Microcoleus sp. FACHB-831 TaxID=2692827 RepID=UPI0016859D01|nr:hypothetical protein [Microcoleus sp. FACHB-831]MBD1922598.1 hypothetical protein [Microcoleus sp. FACHB-831]
MLDQNSKKFRAVNPSLGTAPKVGPFPADQVVPWTAIFLTSYYVCKVVFRLSWLWTCLVAGWGMATWWVLTGSKTWRYMSKFVSTPTWTRGYAQYQQILNTSSADVKAKVKLSSSKNRRRNKRG